MKAIAAVLRPKVEILGHDHDDSARTGSSQYRNRPAGRRIAFWGDSGGSIVVNDFDARMIVAFVMNRHLEYGGIDQRRIDIVCAAHDSLADFQ